MQSIRTNKKRSFLFGVLISPGLIAGQFVFRPQGEELSQNFYGFGPSLKIGYSHQKVLDFSIGGVYLPGKRSSFSILSPQARTMMGGAFIGARFWQAVYLTAAGGYQNYELLDEVRSEADVPGKWSGAAFGGGIGLIVPIDKESIWLVQVEALTSLMRSKDNPQQSQRTLDSFGLSLTFVYNEKRSLRSSSGIMSPFGLF